MRRTLLVGVLLLGLAGCGAEPIQISAIVRVDPQLRSQTAGLVVWVLGPEMSDGVVLPCSALMVESVYPSDSKVKNLGRRDVDPNNAASVVMENVEAGLGRIVYVTANDLSGTRIGAGCTDGIEVPDGGAVAVEVRVFATP